LPDISVSKPMTLSLSKPSTTKENYRMDLLSLALTLIIAAGTAGTSTAASTTSDASDSSANPTTPPPDTTDAKSHIIEIG
jgi:hypothetical protein